MVFSALMKAAKDLAATILPPDALPIPPVQPAFNLTDTVGSRTKLQGAIARAPGPIYFYFPDVASMLTSRSGGLNVSDDGNPASASYRSETAFAALNIDSVIFDVLKTAAGSGALPMTVGGTPSGSSVTFSPAIGTPFDSFNVTIGVGAPQIINIDQAVGLVASKWIPWAGTPGAPPAMPIQAGVATLIAADPTIINQDEFLGVAGSPSRAMRNASLGVILTVIPTTCAHTASLVAGMTNSDIARPLSVALASIQAPANAADGIILSAARLAVPPFFAALAAAIDAIPAHHAAIISANANLTAHGVTVGLAEVGRHIGQLLQAAEANPAPPPPGSIGPSPDPLAAAISAALASAARPAADPFQIEATRLLSSASLSTAQMTQAVATVAASLRTMGFVPPPPHLPPAPLITPPPAGFGAHLGFVPPPPPSGSSTLPPACAGPFRGLIVAGSSHLAAERIVHEIAASFGKTDSDLTTAISQAAGRPPPDAFFSSDTAGLATRAAENWNLILAAALSSAANDAARPIFAEHHPSTITEMLAVPPSSWLEAGRRLNIVADAAREARIGAPRAAPAGISASREDTDKSAIPKSSSGVKGKATAASGATIGCLTAAPVIAAEAAAIRVADPIGEARRIRDTSYGGPALTYLLSDGTASGTMPNKCTPRDANAPSSLTSTSSHPSSHGPARSPPQCRSPRRGAPRALTHPEPPRLRQHPDSLLPAALILPPAPSHPHHLISSRLIPPSSHLITPSPHLSHSISARRRFHRRCSRRPARVDQDRDRDRRHRRPGRPGAR